MRLKLASVLAAAVLCMSLPAAANNAAMNARIDTTNFLVNRGCSGTLIDAKNDYILTAHHCITTQYEMVEREKIQEDGTVKKEKVRVVRPGMVSQIFYKGPAESQRNSYVYKIIRSDAELDLALLKVQAKLPYAEAPQFACNDLARLDKVYAVGNSYSVLYSSITEGIVSSVTRSYRDLGLVGDLADGTESGEAGLTQHSAVIAGGNSGGALYNAAGEFTGVNVRGAATGFSFAVPLVDVKRFLTREGLSVLWERCEEKK